MGVAAVVLGLVLADTALWAWLALRWWPRRRAELLRAMAALADEVVADLVLDDLPARPPLRLVRDDDAG